MWDIVNRTEPEEKQANFTSNHKSMFILNKEKI